MPRDLGDTSSDKLLKNSDQRQERLEREAKALRQNLLRRKQQSRVRSAATSFLMAALRNEENT